MTLEAFVVVLGAALLHATWNAIAKGSRHSDPRLGVLFIGFGSAAVSCAGLLLLGLPSSASMPYAVASAVTHVGYFLFMGAAYRAGDLSAAYPIIRGAAPLGTAALGWALFGESLPPMVWLGIVVLAGGILAMAAVSVRQRGLSRAGVAFALGNAAIIVAYTLIDGRGVRLSGAPLAYVMTIEALTGPLLLPLLLRHRAIGAALRGGVWWRSILGGGLSILAYAAALWAMTQAPIGMVAALRETSVLWGVLIGGVVLRERVGPARWAAAGTIVAGVVLVRLAG